MKLSLRWIFDHIATSWNEHSIQDLVACITSTIAEVELFEFYQLDFSLFTIIKVVDVAPDSIIGFSQEYQHSIALTPRDDIQAQGLYLVKKTKGKWSWATAADFKAQKEGLLPALTIPEDQIVGAWKTAIEQDDYIFTIANTALTHRPDLWSHRGFAREIAVLLSCPLRDEQHFFTDYEIKFEQHDEYTTAADNVTFGIATSNCKRLAGLSIAALENKPSLLDVAYRLLRIDGKPINTIVDFTNYVMYDIGQPMHAFDAARLATKKIIATQVAHPQSMLLLDGQEITVSAEDLIISDGQQPVALAGIMGGQSSAISSKTRSIIIEAATFDASTIRKSSLHFKLRTEASTRFEKSLDSEQPPKALLRFLHLLEKNNISYQTHDPITCLGSAYSPIIITFEHGFIEKKIGARITELFVVKTLESLGFPVKITNKTEIQYTVTVPSWRAKDVTIAEDLVEEVVRFYGFHQIAYELPQLPTKPMPWVHTQKKRTLKQLLAYHGLMREVQNYAFYDVEFLLLIGWQPRAAFSLKNPISEHMTQLVTSLIPHLCKTVYHNKKQHDTLHFFECNKIWPTKSFADSTSVDEQLSIAGIFYDEKNPVDFYQKKEILINVLASIGVNMRWVKTESELPIWYHPYKTAALMHEQTVIGYAGCVNPGFLLRFLSGDAFIFELNAGYLMEIQPKHITMESLAKYQDTWRDISMFIPASLYFEQIMSTIKAVSSLIFDVALIDFFQKPEWQDKRAVTVRFFARDPHKTLTTEEIDQLYQQIITSLSKYQVEVR